MKNCLLLTILLFSFASCRTVKTIPIRTDTKITERLVPVLIPADSAVVSLTFKVDTVTNLLTLQGYSESKTTAVETSIKQHSNAFEIKFKVPEREEKVITRDTTTSRDVIVPVQVDEKKRWGAVVPWLVAGVACLLLLIILLIKFLR